MIIRKALIKDKKAVYDLYKEVAKNERGIARMEDEITEQYMETMFDSVERQGIMLVGVDENSQMLIAEIHATKYGIKIFDHILTHLTLVVHPDYQRKGLGKTIFQTFLEEAVNHFPETRRIELESRASNQKSIGLYKRLGFVQEGIMRNKTRNKDGSFEDSLLMAWTNPK
jgi:ribosomal protein S18 acetylase RimI-like enzyme